MFGSVELNDKYFCEQEMSDIADITSSKRIYAHEYQKSGVPFYRSKEIIELGNKKKPSKNMYQKTGQRNLKSLEVHFSCQERVNFHMKIN